MNLRRIAHMNLTEIILKNVRHHPNFRQVRDREETGGVVEALDPLKACDILLDNGS